MNINRREFVQALAVAGASGLLPAGLSAGTNIYDIPAFGQVRLLHITDVHAQLNPTYFREPHINIGIGDSLGRPPHIVGEAFLKHFGISPQSAEAYAFTYKDFPKLADQYGKLGGFSYLKTLIDRLRQEYGAERTLLLDGGDSWQGSATALWTNGLEMVQANNLLGVDIATGHWEFTYEPAVFQNNLQEFAGEFIAQNIFLTEEALFDEKPAYDDFTGHAFPPYTIRSLGGYDVAIIGQAFPYTPIANPSRNVPDWTFGIRATELQELVDKIHAQDKPDAVILLSHNGMDVDVKLAGIVTGIDAILGGHTHDAVPKPVKVQNSQGMTLVTNAGSNGKFVGVLDLQFGEKGIAQARYRLLPVFSNQLAPDPEMAAFIQSSRAPYAETLEEQLAISESLLFRRGNFNGTFDQVICDALRAESGAQIALSPGFRWGTSIVPGQPITFEDVMTQTAMTYPETYVNEMTGETLKLILEDVADNSFNPDPFYQQGGDMVRVSGMSYTIDINQSMGERILDLRLDNGELIQADKSYSVTGWATVGSVSPGPPVWDVVTNYLKSKQTILVEEVNQPKILIKSGNPGIGDWNI